jgi:hypothetical protein
MMTRQWLSVGTAIAWAVLLAGCSGSGTSSETSHHRGEGHADAQVLGDIVEWAFPLPGAASQDRSRRVTNFSQSLIDRECQATPTPLDHVEFTLSNQYPDLDLIRERGLDPIYDPVKYYGLTQPYGEDQSPECQAMHQICAAVAAVLDPTNLDINGQMQNTKEGRECLAEQERVHRTTLSPAYADAMDGAAKVATAWQNDTMLTVANTADVLAAAKPTAQCLRDGSGLHVTDDDPSDSFLRSVDVAYFSRGSTVTKATMWEWSRLYAECAAPYFDAVKTELLKVRPALIERNREALEVFAAQLVDLGYVP